MARRCVGHGGGSWEPHRTHEPYLMDANFVPRYSRSPFWPGNCDDDLRNQTRTRRAVRPELQWRYTPHGHGCHELLQPRRHGAGRPALPPRGWVP